jgi:rhamnosyltransferase subunit B
VSSQPHVLIVGLGSGGDVHPLIALGHALVERGQRVDMVSSAHFARSAQAAGLTFHECLSEDRENAGLRNPDLWKVGRGFKVLFNGLLDAVPETYRIIESQHIAGKTVMVANAAALAARVARETLGGPLVTVHLQPILLRSLHHQPGLVVKDRWKPAIKALRKVLLPALDRWVFDPVLAPKLNAFRATKGLPPTRRFFAEWIHSPDLVVGFFPEWFARRLPDWPRNTHLVGFPATDRGDSALEPELETFLNAGPPPVVFTFGTAMAFAKRFFEASAQACRRMGRRGLLLTPYADQVPVLPEGVHHFRYAPFNTLLPRAAALVHHGGIGTMAAAFAAGIPQLAVPFNFDQPDNAARLQALGAGAILRPRAYTEQSVAQQLTELLTSDAVLTKCKAIAAETPASAIEAACDLVEAAHQTCAPITASQPA